MPVLAIDGTTILFIIVIAPVALIVGLLVLVLIAPAIEDYKRRVYFQHQGGDPTEYKRAKRGDGLGIDELARRLDLSERELRNHLPRYTPRDIPKRTGGTRRLLVPDDRTKQLQRVILHRLLAKLRAHHAAMGFEEGRSIVDNAAPHVGRAVVIRMDIVDFFPSITAERVEWYFRRVGWNAEAATLLAQLVTHDGGLPQGAPTSPRLSNLVNFYMDVQLARFAAKRKGVYTRYADDITFSFPKDYPKRVRGVVLKTYRVLKAHGYRMHKRKKLHIRRAHQRQVVTGLIVNDGGRPRLPRKTRRWLRAVEHRLRTGGEASLTEEQLAGWRALRHMIESHDDG